ncbi:MAG: 3-oxoacyl-ACP reductase [Gammaproteobacteria bacterium]|nr:MAG: 3-oxoacyl-ACP reductase [Gammaproteobacteria bacterium]
MSDLSNKHPIINWFLNNPVTANLLMLGVLLGGLYMVGFFGLAGMTAKLPLEVFPLVDTNRVTVSASLNGSSPEDVERGVTNKIEEALQSVQGIDEITSRSTANVAEVSITAVADYDIDTLLDDVKAEVDSLNGLPAEVEKVRVAKNVRRRGILWVTLSGDVSEAMLLAQAERLKQRLLANSFVEAVDIDGKKAREIAVEIEPDTLTAYGLSLSQVAASIDGSSLDLSVGELQTSQGRMALRIKNQAHDSRAYADLVIRSQADGASVRLGDIATLRDGFVEQQSISEFNEKPSLTLRLSSREHANVIEADKAATTIVNDFKNTLPAGITTTMWNNNVVHVRDRINLFLRNATSGVLLVFLLLTLFVNFRLAFWVVLGIPVSFAGALLAMGAMNLSINLITLFGFIIVLGIVVDDAIVIGESIYTWKKRTQNAPEATLRGTARVSTAATFGVLTTVVAFLPLTQVAGGMGDILGQIGWVVIFCLLFSLLESKLILPSHLHHTRVALREDRSRNPWVRLQLALSHGLEALVQHAYLPVLTWTLRFRYFTLVTFIALFILAIGTVIGGILKVSRFPHVEAQSISLSVTMDNNIDVDTTIAWARKAAKALRRADEQLMTEAGSTAPNITHIAVNNKNDTQFSVHAGLAGSDSRTLGAQAIANRWREVLGRIAGAKTVSFVAKQRFSRADIDIQLLGGEPKDQTAAAQALMAELASTAGVTDIYNSEDSIGKEIHIDMKPEANSYGITHTQLARAVRSAFYGVQAERLQRGSDEIRVMVRYPKRQRQSLADLENFHLTTATGQSIPIHAVARLSYASSPNRIMHLDLQRVVSVYADVERHITSSDAVVADLQSSGFLNALAQQYGVEVRLGGEAREGAKSDASMKVGFVLSLLMIYVLLAVALKSYSQPVIIMSVIPFGIIGAIVGHLLLGRDFSMVGMFGVIALSGVVVNDSLLFISTIGQQRQEGKSVFEAIQYTGLHRFRPIILTSVTTFTGLMPILFETSFQAQFLIPMAISLGFGILFATAITLILVPILYGIFYDVKRFWRRVFWVEKSLDI